MQHPPSLRKLPQASLTPPPDAASAQIILAQRVDLLYQALPVSQLGTIINASLLYWLLWDGALVPAHLAWLGATLLLAAIRLLAWNRYRHRPKKTAIHRWRFWGIAGVIVSGVLWGAASILLFDHDSVVNQALLAMVVAGMAGGAVNTLAVFRGAAVSFLALLLTPFILRMVSADTELGFGMTIMSVLYLTLLVSIALRYNRTIIDGLEVAYARRRAEETVVQQAFYDPLTELPNRRLLIDRLQQEIARSIEHDQVGAVLFLDLDRFKSINDSLGHQVGDQVLRTTARRLSTMVGADDTAARLAGDEFVLVVAGSELSVTADEAARLVRPLAEIVRSGIEVPIRLDGHELHVSTSIGIALFPSDGEDPEELLRAADTAMYRAKQAGRNTLSFFLPEMQRTAVERMKLETALRRAINEDELELVLQPQVDAQGRIRAAEVLLRWQRDNGQWCPPSEFVVVAEETGLIYALGDWVLEHSCKLLARLEALPKDQRFGRLAVNISAKQFRRPDFCEGVEARLARYNADPDRLELEVTEHIVVDDVDDTRAKMNRLRTAGVSFAIDDFGTGYSSLAYLKRLPVDTLKIDQSFVRDLNRDPTDAAIVEAILVMAHHLGLQVVAEGVDNDDALEFLKGIDCDLYQGYLLHRPMRPEAFLNLLGESRERRLDPEPSENG